MWLICAVTKIVSIHRAQVKAPGAIVLRENWSKSLEKKFVRVYVERERLISPHAPTIHAIQPPHVAPCLTLQNDPR